MLRATAATVDSDSDSTDKWETGRPGCPGYDHGAHVVHQCKSLPLTDVYIVHGSSLQCILFFPSLSLSF